jgi:hypothetical protein
VGPHMARPDEKLLHMPVNELIAHEADLAKLEEQRIQNIETQATTVLTVVLALAAFAASALDIQTLNDHTGWIGVVVLLMLAAAGFAVAARWPRALLAGFGRGSAPTMGRRRNGSPKQSARSAALYRRRVTSTRSSRVGGREGRSLMTSRSTRPSG